MTLARHDWQEWLICDNGTFSIKTRISFLSSLHHARLVERKVNAKSEKYYMCDHAWIVKGQALHPQGCQTESEVQNSADGWFHFSI
jgi:hypothetical protein